MEPNTPSKTDILAAREIVKGRNHYSHWRSIDEGLWDDWGAMQSALAELIRQRTGEGDGE